MPFTPPENLAQLRRVLMPGVRLILTRTRLGETRQPRRVKSCTTDTLKLHTDSGAVSSAPWPVARLVRLRSNGFDFLDAQTGEPALSYDYEDATAP